MKCILILFIFIFLNNCSLNKDSQYWTEEVAIKEKNNKKLSKILKKTDDITTMSFEEYEIYIDEHIKKSKDPDISK